MTTSLLLRLLSKIEYHLLILPQIRLFAILGGIVYVFDEEGFEILKDEPELRLLKIKAIFLGISSIPLSIVIELIKDKYKISKPLKKLQSKMLDKMEDEKLGFEVYLSDYMMYLINKYVVYTMKSIKLFKKLQAIKEILPAIDHKILFISSLRDKYHKQYLICKMAGI